MSWKSLIMFMLTLVPFVAIIGMWQMFSPAGFWQMLAMVIFSIILYPILFFAEILFLALLEET